jgi:nicotinate phosphoribosyltransferase
VTVGSLPTDHTLGLVTDLYELRMAQTCLREGLTAPSTFSLYIRPDRMRPWYLAAGTERALDLLERFRYGEGEIDYLAGIGLGDDLLDWLGGLELEGEVWAVPDGTVILADEPLLEYTAPLPQAMLVESAIMNVVQLPTLIATKAARCAAVAEGRTLADFGLRRAQGIEAGMEAARAAYIGGVGATSNVEAGRRFGIPVVGTMAHSFVQALEDELAAFRAFGRDHPDNAILLVDTYDTLQGVRNAITVGEEMRERGEDLDGVRLDSGDLEQLARTSRRMLDEAGFEDAEIFASGGVDEHAIAALVAAGAPIDAFGVGTSLTTSRDHPAFDIVYKLVDHDGHPRAKYSEGKGLLPGAKQVFRTTGPDSDVLGRRDEDLDGEPLLRPVWRDGGALVREDLEEARDRAEQQLAMLPQRWRDPIGPDEAPRPTVSDALRELAAEVRAIEVPGG